MALQASKKAVSFRFHRALFQVVAGRVRGVSLNELLKDITSLRKPTLKRAGTQAKVHENILRPSDAYQPAIT